MREPLDYLKSKKEEEYPRPLRVLIEMNKEKRRRESREKLAKHVNPKLE